MKIERPLQKHEIPRRRERAIVNNLWRDLERLAYDVSPGWSLLFRGWAGA